MIVMMKQVPSASSYPRLMRAPDTITVNRNTYVLETAVMDVPKHAIAGFTCADANGVRERYVFDSNNSLTQEDWPSGEMPQYDQIAAHSVTNPAQSPEQQFKGFYYVLYSLSRPEQQRLQNLTGAWTYRPPQHLTA